MYSTKEKLVLRFIIINSVDFLVLISALLAKGVLAGSTKIMNPYLYMINEEFKTLQKFIVS